MARQLRLQERRTRDIGRATASSGGFVRSRATIRATWLEVIGALRYDSYELNGGGASSSGDRVSPKITVGLTPLSWFTIYSTYAEGYRAPAISETLISGFHPAPALFAFLPNTSLRPEVGQNKEIGINIRQDGLLWQGDALRIKANYFINDIENFIPAGQHPVQPLRHRRPALHDLHPLHPVPERSRGPHPGLRVRGALRRRPLVRRPRRHPAGGREPHPPRAAALKIPPRQVATTFGTRFYDRKITAAVRWLWVDAKHPGEIPLSEHRRAQPAEHHAYNVVNLYSTTSRTTT